jgi:hypothetical protein
VAGLVALFREDQERRSVFGRRCGRTLAGTLRGERASVLRADIAVVRKADTMRTATKEFSKIWIMEAFLFRCAGRLGMLIALVKEICACLLGGARLDFSNRLSTSR